MNPQTPSSPVIPVQTVPVATPPSAQEIGMPTVPPQPVSKKSNAILIVGAFAVVALLIGIGIFLYSKVSKDNPELNQTTAQIQDTVNTVSTDIQNLVIEDVSADFAEVDSELSQL